MEAQSSSQSTPGNCLFAILDLNVSIELAFIAPAKLRLAAC